MVDNGVGVKQLLAVKAYYEPVQHCALGTTSSSSRKSKKVSIMGSTDLESSVEHAVVEIMTVARRGQSWDFQ